MKQTKLKDSGHDESCGFGDLLEERLGFFSQMKRDLFFLLHSFIGCRGPYQSCFKSYLNGAEDIFLRCERCGMLDLWARDSKDHNWRQV